MSEAPSDHYRDKPTLERVNAIAAGIFARYGINFTTAQRAGG
jgi:hypothetical protein